MKPRWEEPEIKGPFCDFCGRLIEPRGYCCEARREFEERRRPASRRGLVGVRVLH